MAQHPNTGREKAGVIQRAFAPAGALWQQYAAQKRSERNLQATRQKDELARQDSLSKYASAIFDKDLGTGTTMDPIFSNAQAQGKEATAEMIKANPNMSNADLDRFTAKFTGNIKAASDMVKAHNTNIKSYAAALDKVEGVDGKALEELSRYELIYKEDGAQRTIDEILNYKGDPTAIAMEKHSDKIVTREALDVPLAKLGTTTKSIKPSTDNDGNMISLGRDVTYIAALHNVDDQGNITTKSKMVNVPLSYLDKSFPRSFVKEHPAGSIEVLDQDAYDRVFGTQGGAMYLEKEMKKRYPDADKLNPSYDIIKRKVAFDLVDDYADRTGMKENKVQKEAAWKAKWDFGIRPGSTSSSKGIGPNGLSDKLNNSTLGIIARGVSGDPVVLEGARHETIYFEGKPLQVVNFARGEAGNVKLPDDIWGKGKEARTIAPHPTEYGTLIVESTDGVQKTFKGKELRNFFLNVGRIQSPPIGVDDTMKLVDTFFGAEGVPKGKGAEVWDEVTKGYKKERGDYLESLFKNIDSFDGSKDASFREFEKKEISDGGVVKKIKKVSFLKRNAATRTLGYKDKYTIAFEDGTEKVFTTKEELSDFLTNIN